MPNRPERELLNDILEAIRRVSLYVDEMTYAQFMADTKTQDAVIRNLEIVGEATKRLPPKIRIKHPAIPWKSMAGTRDRLIHDYFGVNFDIVWQIVTEELPSVATQIALLLTEQSD